MSLLIENLTVKREAAEIVHGVTLEIPSGEVHALMGPNGSGKSSLANAVMGHPKHAVTAGAVRMDGDDITALAPDEKSRKGLFLSLQSPPEIPGVTVANFLRAAVAARRGGPVSPAQFRDELRSAMTDLGIDPSFASRALDEGFSGGERKRIETLQLVMLGPKYAILDETDSGLDVDALGAVAEGINRGRGGMGILVITHYARILAYLKPDRVHVMVGGRIVASGGPELAREIEKNGYGAWIPQAPGSK